MQIERKEGLVAELGYRNAHNWNAMRLLGHCRRITGSILATHDVITAKKAKIVVKGRLTLIKMAANGGVKINQIPNG